MKNKWVIFLAGWVIGSYFGLSHILGMVGSKKNS